MTALFAHGGAIVVKLLNIAVLCAALGAGAAAGADEINGQLIVSVNVVASCRLSIDAVPLSFGNVDQSAGDDATAHANIDVLCSSEQPYAVGFDYGQHAASAQRRMSNGSADIVYGLYADAAHHRAPGADGQLRGMGNGEKQQLSIYTEMKLAGNMPADWYNDVVRLIVTW